MPTAGTFEAKSNLSRLVEAVETSAEAEIIIARNGRPVARLVPSTVCRRVSGTASPKVPSSCRTLLDTHIALWAIAADPRLARQALDLIADPGTVVAVSAASFWGIAIEHALARGRPTDMPVSGPDALSYFRAASYQLIAVTTEHAATVAASPAAEVALFVGCISGPHGGPIFIIRSRSLAAQ